MQSSHRLQMKFLIKQTSNASDFITARTSTFNQCLERNSSKKDMFIKKSLEQICFLGGAPRGEVAFPSHINPEVAFPLICLTISVVFPQISKLGLP